MIHTYIKEGQVVPMEVTIKLLENAMRAALEEGRTGEGWGEGRGRFLIDGFPRKMDQAVALWKVMFLSKGMMSLSGVRRRREMKLRQTGRRMNMTSM